MYFDLQTQAGSIHSLDKTVNNFEQTNFSCDDRIVEQAGSCGSLFY